MHSEKWNSPESSGSVGSLIINAYTALAVLSAFAQIFILHALGNIISSAFVATTTILTAGYLKRVRAFSIDPVVAFALIGLSVTTQWGALVLKTLSGDPLVEGLSGGPLTVALLCCVQILALLSHQIYRGFNAVYPLQAYIKYRILRPIGFYEEPAPWILWLMGLVGVAAIMLGEGGEEANIDAKIFIGLRFYAWAPFLMPVYGAMNSKDRVRAGLMTQLFVYALLLVVLGVLKNTRVLMFNGVTVMVLAFLLIGLMSREAARFRHLKNVLVGLVAISAVVHLVSNLTTAMVIVRGEKAALSVSDMLVETFDVLSDGRAIDAYKENNRYVDPWSDYDEIYLKNPVLARFVETKFHDNSIYLAQNLSEEDKSQVAEVALEQAISILPEPAIKMLGLDVDKWGLQFTFGDYLLYLAKGYGLGGYRTGSVYVQAWVIFGNAAPLILLAMFFLKMFAIGLLGIRGAAGGYYFSPVLLLSLWGVFISSFSADSLAQFLSNLVRQPFQTFALYIPVLVCIAMTRRDRPRKGVA